MVMYICGYVCFDDASTVCVYIYIAVGCTFVMMDRDSDEH
mgnify:CR=1 FL=1